MLRTSRRAPAALPWLRMPWGLMRYSALGVIAAAPRQVAAYGVYYLFCTAHVAPHAPSNACTAPVAVLEQELWFMSYFSRMRLKVSYASGIVSFVFFPCHLRLIRFICVVILRFLVLVLRTGAPARVGGCRSVLEPGSWSTPLVVRSFVVSSMMELRHRTVTHT